MKKKTAPKTATSKPNEGKYGFLITDPKDITIKHIDEVCDHIVSGNFMDTAITLAGIDHEFFYKMMNNRKTYPNAKYAHDSTKKAMALQEEILLKQILDSNNFNKKEVLKFCELVNPKFARKYKTQMTYELAIMLDVVKQNVSSEVYMKILDSLRLLDAREAIAALDYQLSE